MMVRNMKFNEGQRVGQSLTNKLLRKENEIRLHKFSEDKRKILTRQSTEVVLDFPSP